VSAPENPTIRILNMTSIGAFSWRWPEAVEHFERGWLAVVSAHGSEFQIRHGIGRRDAFGRSRVRSVTWVEGEPMVEGVEADDFKESEALLSLIKVTKKHLRRGDPIPVGYAALPIALMSEEISAPNSPSSLAVKLRQDDIEGWTRHAILRASAWGRLRHRSPRASLPPVTSTGPGPTSQSSKANSSDINSAVVAGLLLFGRNHHADGRDANPQFTPNPATNELVRSNPFAFLLAVLMDQGISA
jgi:hypothetical protein